MKRNATKRTSDAAGAGTATVPAAEFKARCLELMDRVRETGGEFVVTKRGRPVARLVPYAEAERPSFFGAGRGSVLQYDRPFEPIDGDYDVNHT